MRIQFHLIRVAWSKTLNMPRAAFRLPRSFLFHILSVHGLLSRAWRRLFVWLQLSLHVWSEKHRCSLWYSLIPSYGVIDHSYCWFRPWPCRSGDSALAAWGNQGLASTAILNNQDPILRYLFKLLQISSGISLRHFCISQPVPFTLKDIAKECWCSHWFRIGY
jgi:hypothetical protein